MRSSTSSSDPSEAWRGFFGLSVASALVLGVVVYGFVAIIDPWDALPLSPRLPRAQLSQDARFWFPSLARSQRFDSAVLGTSTSRLLRPAVLNAALGGSFVNLAMNSAAPYEQAQLLSVFLRHHPEVKTVLIGVDFRWCAPPASYVQHSIFAFPDWLYGPDRWRGYLHVFSMDAVEAAGKQFAVLVGWKPNRFGPDGYTNFLPDESQYDLDRVRSKLGGSPVEDWAPEEPVDQPDLDFPALDVLAQEMASLPGPTSKILFLPPVYLGSQPTPGTDAFAASQACKFRIAKLVSPIPNSVVVDFNIPSPITREETNYWDTLHYRVPVAERLAQDLGEAANGRASLTGDYRLLRAQPVSDEDRSRRPARPYP